MAKDLAASIYDYSAVSKEAKGQLINLAGEFKRASEKHHRSGFEMGEILHRAREVIGDKEFPKWAPAELKCSVSTAYNYLNAWEDFGSIPNVWNIELSAMYALTKNDAAKKEAIRRAAKGETITHKVAKGLIAKHKPASSRGPRIGNGSPIVDSNTVDAESVTPTEPPKPSVRAMRALEEAGIEPTPEQAAALAGYDAASQVELAKNVAIGAQDLDSAVSTGEIVDLGKCPVCNGAKWSDDGSGLACNKCHHPHGEPAGDPDERAKKEARSLAVKTIEAAQRSLDDLQRLCVGPQYKEGVDALKVALRIAKAWKVT